MTENNDISLLDQQGKEVHSVAKDCDTYRLYATVCRYGTILIAAINKERDKVSIKQYTSELKYMKTLITDHFIEENMVALSAGILIRRACSVHKA